MCMHLNVYKKNKKGQEWFTTCGIYSKMCHKKENFAE